jgi:hypothetical protein
MPSPLPDMIAEFRRQQAEFRRLRGQKADLLERVFRSWSAHCDRYHEFLGMLEERGAVSEAALAASWVILARSCSADQVAGQASRSA